MKKNIQAMLILCIVATISILSAREQTKDLQFVAFSQIEKKLLQASKCTEKYVLLGKREEQLIRYCNDLSRGRNARVIRVLENCEKNVRLMLCKEYELLLEDLLSILSPRDASQQIDPNMVDRLFDAAEYTKGYLISSGEPSEDSVELFICRGDKNEYLAADRINFDGMNSFALTRTNDIFFPGVMSLRQVSAAVQTITLSGLPNPVTGVIQPLGIGGIAELPDDISVKDVAIGNEHRVGIIRVGKLCEGVNLSGLRVDFSAVPQTGVYIKCILTGRKTGTTTEQVQQTSVFFQPSLTIKATPSPSITVFGTLVQGPGIFLVGAASDFGNVLSIGRHLLLLFGLDALDRLDNVVISYKILGQNITTVTPDLEACS